MKPRDRTISAIDGAPEEAETLQLDLGDVRSVKAAKRESKTALDIENETLRAMMSVDRNRKWFHDLLSRCHILHNPFSTEPLRMAFSCGEMNIGQHLFIQMHLACPDLYLQMMEENNG